ncbi:hypothetical protein [Arsenicicoccus sp. oral taxon 190]|uniref:hypothetical protein n=1 Tax=Arsenicicoccus sp. oral taxon 190 TaxID=1658671 RepID=UPI000AD903F9|nr:hypothetical protein [Arsenicicoccus sp. oral taxon 190]
MVQPSPPPAGRAPEPSRRLVLGAAALLPLGLLTGCRVRLEDDAPQVPLIPTREPTEDEALILAAWRDATDLARMARALGAPGATAARLHEAHARVFDQELRDRRVPPHVRNAVGALPTGSSTSSGSSGSAGSSAATTAPTAPPVTAASLAQREAAAWGGEAVAGLGTAHERRVAMLASFATCRARLAAGLGGSVPWPAWGGTATAADAALVAAHREARFFLEVAAARTPPADRAPVAAQLDRVEAVVVRLQSRSGGTPSPSTGGGPTSSATDPTSSATDPTGSTTGPTGGATGGASPGPSLPFAVPDAAAARRLVTHALRTLELRCGAAWPDATGSPEGVVTVSRLVADALAAGAEWGVPLRAFPGLVP